MQDDRVGSRFETRAAAWRGVLLTAGIAVLLSGCAGQQLVRNANGRTWDPKLGVWSSPKLVADGDPVPRGGGAYLTGRPYTIGGHTYVPSQNPSGYTAVGTASWYGDAFHGRRTANGEIFDKGSISAAHPTLPLPSYVRVTNLKNGRSMVVRVNDRGPYHGGRVMDVSQRVADTLQFRGEGTARVKIDYVGRAPLQGSDDERLVATLRTDGAPAQIDGLSSAQPVMVARDAPDAAPPPVTATAQPIPDPEGLPLPPSRRRGSFVPLPPARPFILGEADPTPPAAERPRADRLADLIARSPRPLTFAPEEDSAGPLRRSGRGGARLLQAGDRSD